MTRALKTSRWISFIQGLFVGLFIGWAAPKALDWGDEARLPTEEELLRHREKQEALQEELAQTATQIEWVEKALVRLNLPVPGHKGKAVASVILTLADGPGPTPEQVVIVAQLVGHRVESLQAGNVSIYDAAGNHLNEEAGKKQKKREFWTNIAINVAKILGIIATLLALRFAIQAVGRWANIDGEEEG